MARRALLPVLLATLAAPALAQGAPDLDGLFAGTAGSGIALFNPEPDAPLVHVTPALEESLGSRVDSLDGQARVNGTGGSRQLSFSPSLSEAGRMAFLADWLLDDGTYGFGIYAADRDGTDLVRLTGAFSNRTEWETDTPRPRISPDGQTVVYTVVTAGRGNNPARGSLWVVPSDGSAPPTEVALPHAVNAEGGCVQQPLAATFSPDGTEILYLGLEPATYQPPELGAPPIVVCHPALRLVRPDGTGDRVFYATVSLDGSGASSPRVVDIYHDARLALDWRGDVIVFSGPQHRAPVVRPAPEGPLPETLRFVRASTGEAFEDGEAPAIPLGYKARSIRLSPDATRLGYVRDLVEGGAFEHRIAVRPIEPTGTEYVFSDYDLGQYYGFDWADLPALPAPASFALEATSELSWFGRSLDLAPVLRAADGSVLSRTVRFYEFGTQTHTAVDHFAHRLWGRDSETNRLGEAHCAENGGLRACRRVDVVNTPILGIEVVDDEIAEEGRDPGVYRLWRYGRPDVESIPVWEVRRSGSGVDDALHYLDFTLSVLPERIRWAASDALADTLQSREVTLTPVDDGLAEPDVERGQLHLACVGATGSIFGPDEENCAVGIDGDIPGVSGLVGSRRDLTSVPFEIASNGAGAGLALASSAPATVPASGRATLTIQGQGFAEGMTASIDGVAMAEHVAVLFDGVQARARFVLDGAPPGTYALTVTADGQTAMLADAVTVEGGAPGGTTDVWATLESRSGRPGLPLTQYVVYGNDGTADAVLTPLLIAIPPGFDAAFTEPLFEFPDAPNDPGASPWISQTLAARDVPGLCFESRGPRGAGRIDCVDGFSPAEPLEYTVALVFLPPIPPGGQGRLGVDVTKTGTETLPWFVKVGAPLNTLTFDDDGAEGGRLAGGLWAGGPRPVAPTSLSGCADARRGAAFDAAQGAACAACISGLTNLALTLAQNSPIGGCVSAAIGVTTSLYQTALDASAGGASNAVGSGLSTLGNVAKLAFECTSLAGAVVPGVGQAALMYSIFSVLSVGTDVTATTLACLNCMGIDPVWSVIGEVYSQDPNDKLGPVAVGDAGYVAEFGRMGYTIRFENLATATAAAVEVTVTDTLDTAVYDLATFELGPVSLQDTTFTPPPGLQAWTTFWDRRPAEPSVVRVHGALDAAAGVATWVLSDLDPEDYRLRTSAEAGFLPPNDADGAGEGWVRFTVDTRPGLPDGAVVANAATIQFDRNELIGTPVWANTLDRSAPTSRALAAEPFDADTAWVVRVEGADVGAGVAGYDLYASADGGPFAYAGTSRADSVVFRGAPGVAYGFFALATDWVGNEEPPKTEAEVTAGGVAAVDAPDVPEALALAAPYPNPTRGAAVVPAGVPAPGAVRVAAYDARGRQVAVLFDGDLAAGWHAVRWEAGALAAGVYVLRVEAAGQAASRSLTVVR